MKLDRLSLTVLVAGWAAFGAVMMYLRGIAPLRADFGIHVTGVLQLIWIIALGFAFRANRRKGLWLLLATLPALTAPAMYVAVAVALSSP